MTAPNRLLARAYKCQHLLHAQFKKKKTYVRLLPLIKLSNKLWDDYRKTITIREYKTLEQKISELKSALAEKDAHIKELEAELEKANCAFSVTFGKMQNVSNALNIALHDLNKHGGNTPYCDKIRAIAGGQDETR